MEGTTPGEILWTAAGERKEAWTPDCCANEPAGRVRRAVRKGTQAVFRFRVIYTPENSKNT
jgi:hypothetical protein